MTRDFYEPKRDEFPLIPGKTADWTLFSLLKEADCTAKKLLFRSDAVFIEAAPAHISRGAIRIAAWRCTFLFENRYERETESVRQEAERDSAVSFTITEVQTIGAAGYDHKDSDPDRMEY